ncbi:carbohydrate ABC transporter permease [Paenibacillus sp. GCM10027626]|uniref:carbohydrate ABC transporter permease n=1 Tax=Paenibacillus sp. GCM10027626 TaxID=3273411 RepID=UPI00364347A3
MTNRGIRQMALSAVLILWAIICLYPLLWMIGASFKTSQEVLMTYSIFPSGKWHWETYMDVWKRLKFFKYFLNSVNVTIFTILGVNLIYTFAAFAFAKLRFPGKSVLFYGFIAMMFVPGITIMIPLYLIEHYLGILNTHIGLILPMVNGAGAFAVFLFRNYFHSIPHEVYESALLEGASPIGIWARIYFPLAMPAIATITIMNFLGSWNSLVLPMVMLTNQDLFTLPLAVTLLDTGVFRQWNVLMAGSLFSIAPVVIVFFFMQKYYIQGLSSGAIKS